LFVGNPRGIQTAAVLATLTSICRRHHIDPQLYFTQRLVNLPEVRASEFSAWLPDQWNLRHAERPANLQTTNLYFFVKMRFTVSLTCQRWSQGNCPLKSHASATGFPLSAVGCLSSDAQKNEVFSAEYGFANLHAGKDFEKSFSNALLLPVTTTFLRRLPRQEREWQEVSIFITMTALHKIHTSVRVY